MLAGEAEFFVFRRSRPLDVWALAMALVALVPLLGWALEGLARLAGRRAQQGLHLSLVAALVSLTTLPPLKRGTELDGYLVLAAAGAAGVLGAWLYARQRGARTFLSILAPLTLLFAALFLANPSVRKVWMVAKVQESPHHVDLDVSLVFVVLDELPLSSVMNEELEVDAELYPNLARPRQRFHVVEERDELALLDQLRGAFDPLRAHA